MLEVVRALKSLGCWKETYRPKDQKVLHTKFVLHRKRNQTGEIEKFKTRPMVREIEKDGDYVNYFWPVLDFRDTKLFMSLCVQKNW